MYVFLVTGTGKFIVGLKLEYDSQERKSIAVNDETVTTMMADVGEEPCRPISCRLTDSGATVGFEVMCRLTTDCCRHTLTDQH